MRQRVFQIGDLRRTLEGMDQPFRTIIEPFRIHSVEPLRMTTPAERREHLAAAAYNPF